MKNAYYWFDPATDGEDGIWTCPIRGGLNGGIICRAEGETYEEATARAHTIVAALESIGKADGLRSLLFDAAMQLERLDGHNLAVYARTFSALARSTL